MLILILCILCNVVLAVIFKAFGKYKIDNLNAIVINYITRYELPAANWQAANRPSAILRNVH